MVVVKFVVEKDGSITNIQIVRDIGGGCGKEVVRIIGPDAQVEARDEKRLSCEVVADFSVQV
ncbi:MAG: hypothetical protein IPJ40_13460 [Saprospirales bacterium]|nr:hypothetical protein [Saprospirales bacterium]